jgi:hypothetical protein
MGQWCSLELVFSFHFHQEMSYLYILLLDDLITRITLQFPIGFIGCDMFYYFSFIIYYIHDNDYMTFSIP